MPPLRSQVHEEFSTRKKEKRKADRKQSDAGAWIRLEGGFAVRACRVIDISDVGVRLQIENAARMPIAFDLLIHRTSPGRRVHVKWRRGNQLGGEFL